MGNHVLVRRWRRLKAGMTAPNVWQKCVAAQPSQDIGCSFSEVSVVASVERDAVDARLTRHRKTRGNRRITAAADDGDSRPREAPQHSQLYNGEGCVARVCVRVCVAVRAYVAVGVGASGLGGGASGLGGGASGCFELA